MHESYEERFNRSCDFRVKYRFFKDNEGARKLLPEQGIRLDFWYECDSHEKTGYFMIWPEFENSNGEIFSSGQVLSEGIARMWIINPEMKKYHAERIKLGTKGYFIEGKKVAECEVIELINLKGI